MKIAVVGDIHSNIVAFEKVLNRINQLNIDDIWCVGDLVGYYAHPDKVVDLIVDNDIFCVMGNHDFGVVENKIDWFKDDAKKSLLYSIEKLDSGHIDFLKKLPYTLSLNRDGISFYLVHASPRDNLFEYVHPYFSDEQLKKIGKDVDADVIIMGHTHVQMDAEIGFQRFLNPGSVGQPRDGIKKSCFMVFDTEKNIVNWHRVSYDIDNVVRSVSDAGLPRSLSDRLFNGI